MEELITHPDFHSLSMILSCNWMFQLSIWQNVQLNTVLLKHRTQYLYTKETGQLKVNERQSVVDYNQIKLILGEI